MTENITGRSLGEPCSLNNEFQFFFVFVFFGTVHAPAIYGLIIYPCNIALISRVLPLLPSLPNGVESKTVCLIAKPSLTSTLFFIAITLVTVLMKWLPLFHLLWLGHIQRVRCHLPTTIVWNFPVQELIGSVMLRFFYSTSYLQTFFHFLFLQLSSTSLPSEVGSIITISFFPIYVLQCSFFSYFNNSF